MKLATVLRSLKLYFLKRGAFPEYVTFFVTSRCNLRCIHCFYWKELNSPERELSIQEIEALSEKASAFHFLLLTGGEPFLRPDLADIVGLFRKNNNIGKLGIPSNGYWNDTMMNSVDSLVTSFSDLSITIYISFDGLEAVHDHIRQRSGAFKKANEAFKFLKDLQRQNPNLSVATITTFNHFNQHSIFDIFYFLKEELEPDAMSFPLVRGNPKEIRCKDVNVDIYKELIQRLHNFYFAEKREEVTRHFGSSLITAAKIVSSELNIKTIEEMAYQTSCYAGIINAVIYSNGDVYPCELLSEKMGSLRDVDYDLRKIWRSERAAEVRKKIRGSRCFCYHGCNSISNVLFNPRYFPEILRNALAFK